MKIQKLTKEKRLDIYNNYLIKDFHKSEVKPFDLIEGLVEKDKYACYGFYENEELLGYVYFVKSDFENSLFIDYLAISKEYRSKGFGSRFITTIIENFSEEYSSLIAEVENPEFSIDESDKVNRERRIKFYLKNGFKLSNLKSRVVDDNYVMIQLPLKRELQYKEIYKKMIEIYQTVFGIEFYEKNIDVF